MMDDEEWDVDDEFPTADWEDDNAAHWNSDWEIPGSPTGFPTSP